MYLKSIDIKNYRLLMDVKINVDESATLIVGRNNTGKTSLMDMMLKVVNGKKLCFHDYPILCRSTLYDAISNYLSEIVTYEELIKIIPVPSMRFIVDYSLEKEDQLLGALSPFIIDTDINITEAVILAEYRVTVSEETFKNWFTGNTSFEEETSKKSSDLQSETTITDYIKEILIEHFSEIFSLAIEALNPSNENDKQTKALGELNNLFPVYIIRAERGMDESETQNCSPLSPILTKLFQKDVEDKTPEIKEEVAKLRALVGKSNKEAQLKINKLLNEIIQKTIKFGYPNAEELQLKAITQIALDEQIKNKTDLSYVEQGSSEELPSTYNGLGYKNLIKIEFELAEFAKLVLENLDVAVPILFLEEPESHMHPQLQQTFVRFLTNFLKEISSKPIQVFITTHSSHIVNTVPFKQVRYVQKRKTGVMYKDLSEFCATDTENADFIQKYLTISRCDLFFADKAILIEGAAERLLLPDMIRKCQEKGLYKNAVPDLASQYYALIEVGGAYAHKFCPFMDFLGISTLIITDIDTISDSREKVPVSKGTTSSNAAIKWWIKRECKLNEKDKVSLEQIISFSENKKSYNACHIEYQTEEGGLCGRSLEEAIKNENRSLYGIGDKPTEDDLIFDENKKTDFALELLLEKGDYNIPSYIQKGLIWLNEQRIILE